MQAAFCTFLAKWLPKINDLAKKRIFCMAYGLNFISSFLSSFSVQNEMRGAFRVMFKLSLLNLQLFFIDDGSIY